MASKTNNLVSVVFLSAIMAALLYAPNLTWSRFLLLGLILVITVSLFRRERTEDASGDVLDENHGKDGLTSQSSRAGNTRIVRCNFVFGDEREIERKEIIGIPKGAQLKLKIRSECFMMAYIRYEGVCTQHYVERVDEHYQLSSPVGKNLRIN